MGSGNCKQNKIKQSNTNTKYIYHDNPNNDKLLLENIKYLVKMKHPLINTCIIENVKFELDSFYNGKTILVTNKNNDNDIDIIFTEYLHFSSTKPIAPAYCRNKECPICLESFMNIPNGTYMPVSLKCGHIFHYKCINEWHKTEPRCPYCRTPTI